MRASQRGSKVPRGPPQKLRYRPAPGWVGGVQAVGTSFLPSFHSIKRIERELGSNAQGGGCRLREAPSAAPTIELEAMDALLRSCGTRSCTNPQK